MCRLTPCRIKHKWILDGSSKGRFFQNRLRCIGFGKRIVRTVKSVPVKAWLIPGVCIALSYVLNNIALDMTEATSVAFLRSLAVVMTPALAFIAYRKRYKCTTMGD